MKPPKPTGIMGAFRLNRRAPIPWGRAMGAGLSLAIPILVGVWLGQFHYGLLSTFGAFAYLYGREEPYPRRAITLLFVIISLAVSFGAGSLSAAIAWWCAALVLGLVGAVAVFICEALDVPPPSALFFVFTCALGTSMPSAEPATLLLRAGLILLGGIPAWLIAMSGWLVDPDRPETEAVAGAYRALAAWLAAVGTDLHDGAQHQAAVALRASEKAVAPAALPGRRPGGIPRRRPGAYIRLMRLNQQAQAVFLAIIELTAATSEPVDPKVTAAVRALADAVSDPDRAASLTIPNTEGHGGAADSLYRSLSAALAIAADEEPHPTHPLKAPRGGIGAALVGALGRDSLVLPKAVRMGGVLLVAYVTTHLWGTERPYWVFISCAAVMIGTTVAATLHRAIQRTVGTIAGAVLAAAILALQPSGMMIALTFMALQFLVHLTIALNYALAVTFITPLGFLIAHAGQPELPAYSLVTERLIDVLLGSALGVAGAMLLGRRTSSSRLPGLLSDALRSEGRLLASLLTDRRAEEPLDRRSLATSLLNLRVVYDAAVNELAREHGRLESLWPVVVAVQRLGFFLIALSDDERRRRISKESLAALEGVFGSLASAVEAGRPPRVEQPPVIPEYPVISQELHEIFQGLQVLRLSPN